MLITVQALTKEANVLNPIFMRTTSEEHVSGVVHLWVSVNSLLIMLPTDESQNKLSEQGYIYKGKHSGWYSISDECFYTDSQVTSYVDSKTGQELRVSIETGNVVEWSEETNYKFAISKFRTRLLDYYTANAHGAHSSPLSHGVQKINANDPLIKVIYPEHQYTEDVKQLSSNDHNSLPDLSVSRPSSRLSWGIPVPGDDSQTIYVWLDALTTYLTGIGYPWSSNNGQFGRSGWPADLQVIGKDILK